MIKTLFDTISHAELSLPALEVSMLIAILTVCLTFKFTRTGLIVAYLFVYRWGWLFFMEQPAEMLVGYLIFGCLVCILTVLSMMHSPA